MKPILEIQNIGKKFKIQHEHLPYLSLRDSLKQVFKKSRSTEDFWALQDISFDVMPGDSIGIIGKNGAGKNYPANKRSNNRQGPHCQFA
jgi:lipopolysaccharide transport system ATP-binding protein